MRAGVLGLVALCASPALAGEVVVDFLDVGQGDSVLIRGGGKAVLIDAGTAESGVADQLAALGVERLDMAVATHAHADHIGGMAEVLARFEVALFLDSGLTHDTETYTRMAEGIERERVRRVRARRDMTVRLGEEAILHVLWPGESYLKDTRSDLNSNSVVLWLEHGEVDALFTGDAEEPTEAALLRNGVGEVELLKVAHHGSGHSSSEAFLRRVSPEVAVISCGADNRYGHPDADTLERLASTGARVLRTDTSGQVRAVSNGTELALFEGELARFASDAPPVQADNPGESPLIEASAPPPAPPPPVPEDVAAWLSGVRPSAGVDEDGAEGEKRKKKKKKGKR